MLFSLSSSVSLLRLPEQKYHGVGGSKSRNLFLEVHDQGASGIVSRGLPHPRNLMYLPWVGQCSFFLRILRPVV